MKNGDIYFWSWKEGESPNSNYTLSYWCRARKAIVVDGELYDVYWHDRHNGWLDPKRVDLAFQGNINDFRVSKYGEHLYYDRADLIDMRHPNDTNGPIYIRNVAERSKVVMMEFAADKLEEAERALRYAQQDIEKWTNKIKEIDAAKDLKEVWL